MIVDTSAIVAILRDEPGADAYARLVVDAEGARISAGTYVELGVVIDGARDPVMSAAVDRFLEESRIVIEPLTASQAQVARRAYQQFGRGSGHPARLNMGDCLAYALARELREPLLFTGADFALTDIELVIEPVKHRRLSEILAGYGVTAS